MPPLVPILLLFATMRIHSARRFKRTISSRFSFTPRRAARLVQKFWRTLFIYATIRFFNTEDNFLFMEDSIGLKIMPLHKFQRKNRDHREKNRKRFFSL